MNRRSNWFQGDIRRMLFAFVYCEELFEAKKIEAQSGLGIASLGTRISPHPDTCLSPTT